MLSFTGIEAKWIKPSLSLFPKIVDSKKGFGIGFGPSFGISRVADGYYVDDVEKH